jgi:hypothetical protein
LSEFALSNDHHPNYEFWKVLLKLIKGMDLCRRIPYAVALKHKHRTCAALLNPSSAEPLVWPSPLKFISELNPDAKALLERALKVANMEREKVVLKETVYSLPAPSDSDVGVDDNASEVISFIFFLCCRLITLT